MNTYAIKINLLSEMIAFSIVDGELHEREYQFLSLVANELKISKEELNDLFHQEHFLIPIKSEKQRIQQFYRLALLMHIDGFLHEKEATAIKQIAIDMGLSPSATSRFLELIRKTKNRIIEPNEVYALFKEQRN
ncbi:excinuclease ABC subunit B [Flavobacterium tegetincola]|uniref:excinuclease ABC subunit B n=1 Tax=Flavobacterium tegetincola TaxID=150172 RepID=UPI00042A618E|nr:excinuclease ABC subunit B [Flavobacterium tegetincola]